MLTAAGQGTIIIAHRQRWMGEALQRGQRGDGNRVKKTENNETIIYVNQYYEKNLTIGVISATSCCWDLLHKLTLCVDLITPPKCPPLYALLQGHPQSGIIGVAG